MKVEKKEVVVEGYVRYGAHLHSFDIFFDIAKVALLSKDPVRAPIPSAPSSQKLYLVILRSGSEFFILERAHKDLAKRLDRLHKTDAKIPAE